MSFVDRVRRLNASERNCTSISSNGSSVGEGVKFAQSGYKTRFSMFLSKCCCKCVCCGSKDSLESSCWTKLRHLCQRIKDHRVFDYFILCLIFASSFILVFEDIHLPERPVLQKALEVLDIIFCILFIIEFFIKLIALGVKAYIKNGWNVLDFFIIVSSVAGEN